MENLSPPNGCWYSTVLNLRTAKAIGVTIPDSILVLADKVIE